MRGTRLIHLWGPLSHCYGEKWKSAIQFKICRKWRCGRSISTVNKKILNHYQSPPRSLRLLLPSTQKRWMERNCWNRTWLAGTRLSIFAGKPTGNLGSKKQTPLHTWAQFCCKMWGGTGWCETNILYYETYGDHVWYIAYYIPTVWKSGGDASPPNCVHACTYVWRRKDVKAQRLDHVATRLPWM